MSTAPLPGVRKQAAETALSEGAGLANAQAQVGETIGQIGADFAHRGAQAYQSILIQERERANDAANLEADNRFAVLEQQILYGQNGDGALSRKGKDAFGLPEEVMAAYDQAANEIEKQATTPEQQEHARRTRMNRALNLSSTIQRHVMGERQAWEAGELENGVKNHVNAAVANLDDPRRVALELGDAVGIIKKHGPRAGMSTATVDAAVAGAQTQVHAGVVNGLLARGDDRKAKAYYEEVKGQIQGTSRDELEKAIEVGSTRGEAQRQTDQIILAGGTEAQMREKARGIEDPKVRDEAMSRIEHEWTVRARQEREAKETALGDAYVIVDRAGSTDAVPAPLWEKVVRDGHGGALRSYAKLRAAGVEPETNFSVFYGYMQMAVNEPTEFAKTNLMANRHQLADAELKQLAGLQLSVRQGNAEASAKVLDDFRTANDTIDNSLRLAGIDPRDTINGNPNPKAAAITYLRQRTGELTAALQRRTGKKATSTDIQGIAESILSEPVAAAEGFWSYFNGGQATGTKSITEITIGQVPSAARKEIERVLSAAGRPINDDAIIGLYIRGQQLEGARKKK